MNGKVFAAAFALGLMVVGWVGVGFVGTSWLALAMTVAIAGVYVLGAAELRQFRAGTAALATALAEVPQPLADVGAWLERVPASLRNPVRLRIEGERGQLPGPALTPYLVGLLVMLGMLGTFLGMVVTFKGAVFALEGSTDLQAIRSALAAPIKGLGLSFGTSVAGVAASAMLGLLSAMSRRERLDVARQLDTRIATVLRPFSLAHQRQEAFKALQLQAHALPEVADRLQAMMDGLERRSQQLDAQLLAQQDRFHRDVTVAYTDLAGAVGGSLKDSLAAGARAAGESITPVVEAAMTEIARESQRMHQRVFDATQTQLGGLTEAFGATARSVSDGWAAALQTQARTSASQVDRLDQALSAFAASFEQRAGALLAQVHEVATRAQADQAAAAQQRLQGWTGALEATTATLQGEWREVGTQTLARQQAVCDTLEKTAAAITEHTSRQATQTLQEMARLAAESEARAQARAEADAQRLQAWRGALEATAAALQGEWQQAGVQTLARQQAICETLEATAASITEQAGQQAAQTLAEMGRLVAESEVLVHSRTESEARWTQQQAERMDQLTGLWRRELGALRDDEAARGQAAVERLGELQTALASHLATLGTALEAPMTRLMQTAAEVPQAAAGVITELRQEMARLSERDNLVMAERSEMVEKIGTLLQTLNQASGAQQAAIESLVASAADVLEQAGRQFADTLAAQAGQATDVAAHVAGSAVDLASLGESFNHGIQLFNTSNEKLMDGLQRMEGALAQSMARSDEQLAYYVAQAREVIDLSIASQQGLVEDLRRRDAKPAALAKGAA